MNTTQPPAGSDLLRGVIAIAMAGAAVVAVGVGIRILGEEDESPDAARAPLAAVNVVRLDAPQSRPTTQTYSGVVRARESQDLGFARGGRIAELPVAAGDTVEAGAMLAKLDTRRLESQRDTLQAARDRAAEALEQLEPAEPAGQDPAAGQDPGATLRQLRAQLDRLDAQARAAAGQPAPPSLQAQVTLLQQRIDALDRVSRQQEAQAQRSLVAELDGKLADVEIEIDESTLTAPFAGVIARRHVDVGAVVSPGMPVVRVLASGEMEAWVGLPVEAADRFQAGQTWVFQIGSVAVEGRLTTKLPEIDRGTRTRTVVFRLDASLSDQILPGAVAAVDLPDADSGEGHWLPLSALMRESRGLWSVYAVEGTEPATVSRRYVEVLRLEGDQALVRGTLSAGDAVVAEGTHRLVPGQRVQVKLLP